MPDDNLYSSEYTKNYPTCEKGKAAFLFKKKAASLRGSSAPSPYKKHQSLHPWQTFPARATACL